MALSEPDILAGSGGKPCVLLVEDDPVSSMVLQRVFRSLGVPVDLAPDGTAALAMHHKRPYRLVVSDWVMPGLTGVELCRAFRQMDGPYTYFILCSSKGQREERAQAFDAGVDDFLAKPVDKDELLVRLQVARRILGSEERLTSQNQLLMQTMEDLEVSNENLQFASRRFSDLFQGLPVACFTFDRAGTVHEWNRRAEEVFHIPPEQAFQKQVWDVLGETVWTPERVQAVFDGDHEPFDWTYERTEGDTRWFAGCVISLPSPGAQSVGAVSANVEITERILAERRIAEQATALQELNQRLEHLATTDGLTGLWNHRTFQERLAEFFSGAERAKLPFSLILMDIDRFKSFNDEFGHQVGDTVLRQVANVLATTARHHELPARYGGEEFAILLPNADEEVGRKVAERFRQALLKQTWTHRDVTGSFGISTWRPDTVSSQSMVKEADAALYRSKEAGRNRCTHYLDLVETRAQSA